VSQMQATFTRADWSVAVGYVVVVTAIGSLFYRKRSSDSEYFLGGRKMKVIPVAISLVAADLSAISTMGVPAWGYDHDLELLLSSAVYLLAAPIVMYVFLPFYSRFNFYTGYQYLERRFNLNVRLLGSALFLLARGSHVAIVIYAPSIVLSLLTGIPLKGSILLIGAFTTLYTTLGGMKAVIWTDVMQFSVLVTGMATVFWVAISRVPGGIGTVFHIASAGGRFHVFNFSLNPNELTTVWAMVLGGGTMVLSTLGTDQAFLQRYFTTRSLANGRKSVLLDALIVVPVAAMLFLLGTVLFVYYGFYPTHLAGLPMKDAILPFFVIHEVSGVLSGLIMASIFAASMAVMSAGINSLATVTTIDFYHRLLHHNDSDAGNVLIGRISTAGWGALATAAALFANRLGPLANAFNLVNCFLCGPILGIFLLGMLTLRAKSNATLAGGAAGLIVVSLTAYKSNISFFYFAAIGFLVTFIVGYLLSLIGTAPNPTDLTGLVTRHGIGFSSENRSSPALRSLHGTSSTPHSRCGDDFSSEISTE
jgi:SSS family transporter